MIFNKILKNPAQKKKAQEVIRNLVLARIANPQSKRETVRFLEQEFGIGLNLDMVYRTMDLLDEPTIENIQNKSLLAAQSLFKEKIDVLFYDTTTLYFESFTEDTLKSKGFSKDHKFSEVQVMLSIFVTQEGIPVGYEVFPGCTYEGHTLLKALENLKNRFELNNVVFVADSGMLNKVNISALDELGYSYIVGARIKNMSKTIKDEILSHENYKDLNIGTEIYKSKTIEVNETQTLIVGYNEKRARKDAHDRNEALKKMMKKLNRSKNVSSMISGSAYKKYLEINGNSKLTINESKIEEAKQWDGLHGILTNIKSPEAADILNQYKGLWQVEETFRVSKHDLKIRPIYHWSESRIRAHLALCFMSLVCIRHLEHRVNLQTEKMSPDRIRKALLSVQVNFVKHIKDQRLFGIPSKPEDDAKIIYKTFGCKLSQQPYLV